MPRVFVAVLFCVMSCSIDDAADGAKSNAQTSPTCKSRKDLAGECFKVRGRLRGYSANPPCRIWPVGTNYLLGIQDPDALPSNIACGEGFEVYADFVVCPLSAERKNGARMVCVATATNLRASEVKRDSGH
jgi:hypothetical protein